MPPNPPQSDPRSRWHATACRAGPACAVILFAAVTSVAEVPRPLPESAAEPIQVDAEVPEGIFLPAAHGREFWQRTLATVQADWPVARAVAPDFRSLPPRAGVIESAWVEPATQAARPAWPPERQRLVVRVVPAVGGAWIDAALETQSLSEVVSDGAGARLVCDWRSRPDGDSLTTQLAARLAPLGDPVVSLPPLDRNETFVPQAADLPWTGSRFPRLSRAGHKIWKDYRNFYDCESLVCLSAAFGAGALMANTGFDDTMQAAWQRGVEPTSLGTFFSGCKDIGEGRYVLPIFGVAAATGLVFEGHPMGDVVGEWGSRSLRMFVVGAPPLYVLQLATGAARPSEDVGSQWHFFNDNNGVSGHAFVGAVPFLAAAEMVESPLLKGTLYVCSTFVGFSRMTDDAHYPSQVFLGWYLAWASARAVDATEMHFAGMEVQVVPVPIGDLGGLGVTAAW
ncbi:MAG: phosphatase PAP2 family protein [Planctomycetes bacterium]|nr:phosphatase PAP2 family protein [Planctomycetota bacterium]